MPKAYWIVTYREITNPDALSAYSKLSGPAVLGAGGRILVRGIPSEVYEAGQPLRTVVIEWESLAKAVAVRNSGPYLEAFALLGNGAVRDFRIVEEG